MLVLSLQCLQINFSTIFFIKFSTFKLNYLIKKYYFSFYEFSLLLPNGYWYKKKFLHENIIQKVWKGAEAKRLNWFNVYFYDSNIKTELFVHFSLPQPICGILECLLITFILKIFSFDTRGKRTVDELLSLLPPLNFLHLCTIVIVKRWYQF